MSKSINEIEEFLSFVDAVASRLGVEVEEEPERNECESECSNEFCGSPGLANVELLNSIMRDHLERINEGSLVIESGEELLAVVRATGYVEALNGQ